jgi:hypothetical protein
MRRSCSLSIYGNKQISTPETPRTNVVHTHTKAERILPTIVIKRIFLRPYLSERDPMYGDTRN